MKLSLSIKRWSSCATLALGLIVSACGGSSDGGGGGGAAATSTAALSGSVSSSTSSSSTSVSALATQEMRAVSGISKAVVNACEGSAWTSKELGNCGTTVDSGTLSGATFTHKAINVGTEVVITFADCSQRALGKAGDTGIQFTAITDATIDAFEVESSKDVCDTCIS